MLRSLVRRLFRRFGKSERKIVAVYASASRYGEAVEYMRREAPELPVWLIAGGPVEAAVAARCERVVTLPDGAGLGWRAARVLWPHWVALNVVTWTGEAGFAWLKLAPLFVIPGKLLVMNEQGDFFDAFPLGWALHVGRRARDRAATTAVSAKDLLLGIFWKIAWTLLDPLLALTAAPWDRPAAPPPLGPAGGRRLGVWGAPGQPAPPELAALFDRPDTFAAGFQPGRAGFQKDVIPRAAFRQLQPGEATAVVAPLAEVLVIDAEKLERLGGLPKARSQRCRLLLLFWRAAAAGWKSYSVGAAQDRVPMIADRAFAEAEFCWRLLRERPSPGPGSFDSRRGSVCFHPAVRRRARDGAMRILIVSPYLPYPLSHGGAVRMWNLARELARDCELFLACFREREDQVDYERLRSCFARVVVVDQAERQHRDPEAPPAVVQSRSRAMRAAIAELAAECSPHVLQAEYTQLAGYRDTLPATPAVLVEHDVTFSLHRQLRDSGGAGADYERWHRFESHWLSRYDAVAVMSEEEKQMAVAAGAPAAATWVIPNGVDTERFRPAEPTAEHPPEILYVGSFRHLPNILGFRQMRERILPRLWRRFPELRLRVVAGPEHERHWRKAGGDARALAGDPRIEVEGFVEDLAPHYARSSVVVVPLTVSAGTNIKVMEALACGRPVASTPVGCSGLGLADGKEILIATGEADFAAAVERLLTDADLRRRMGEAGRRAAVERFSWARAAERAREMYGALGGPG